jgi:transcriptional regulator with XRE-family HTH domain
MTGNELKRRRESLNLRQSDVADKLGISYQSYQRYERYKGEEALIPATYYAGLADIFNVAIDAFIPRASNTSINSRAKGSGATAISAGENVNTTESSGPRLTPKESQALMLKKTYDPGEILLTEYIEKLLKIKAIHDGKS